MPIQSWGHSHYWQRDTAGGAPPVTGRAGGYPAWQGGAGASHAGSLLGGLQPVLDRFIARVRWWLAWYRRLRRLGDRLDRLIDVAERWEALTRDERGAVVTRVLDLLESPHYATARKAVRETATTLHFNEPKAWVALSHKLHERYTWAENAWRHLRSCDVTEQALSAQGAIVSNPERNLLVELAYWGYSVKPRD